MKTIAAIVGTALSLFTFSCGGVASDEAAPGAVAEDVEERAPSVEPGETLAQGSSPDDRGADQRSAPVVSFVAAQGCEGIGGTWRGQAYSDPHGGYYEFTAQIAQPDVNRPELTGSIAARSWEGAKDDVVPPETCDGGFHWTVVEDAAGQLRDDGTLSFEGTTWRVGEHLCGDRVTEYSLDKLNVVVPGDGVTVTKLSGVLTDGVVWAGAGLGIELTRVACE